MEEVEIPQYLEAKFVDAHEKLCDSVSGLQLVLAVTVLGKEGSGRDKSTENVVNYERNMVERGVAKFDDSQFHLASHQIWPQLFQPCSFHSSLHILYSMRSGATDEESLECAEGRKKTSCILNC
jgi:hypothetical protein